MTIVRENAFDRGGGELRKRGRKTQGKSVYKNHCVNGISLQKWWKLKHYKYWQILEIGCYISIPIE